MFSGVFRRKFGSGGSESLRFIMIKLKCIFPSKKCAKTTDPFKTIFHVEENTKRIIIFVMFINYRKMEHSPHQLGLAKKLIEWRDFKVAGTAHRVARLKRERLIVR